MVAKVTPAFTSAYKKLNVEQKKAVDTIDGPVLVVAGPGTGKTQILTLRIGNILKETDTPPDAILALTFTEAGVRAMRERLLSLIGPASYRVRIHTFHSFCNSVIQSHPHYFPNIVGGRALTDIDAITIIRGIIDTTELTKLKLFGDPYYYAPKILGQIAELKREKISPHLLRAAVLAEEKKILSDEDSFHSTGRWAGQMKGEQKEQLERLTKTKELSVIFEKYESALRADKRYDFQDMILQVVDAFSQNPDFLQIIQEEYLYILADEHQDANTAQNSLLELLTSYHDNPNLFLVGDEKQAIFSFQGASLEHFAMFTKKFPKAITIDLTTNYRSGQKILDTSHAVMQHGGVAPERNVALVSNSGYASAIDVFTFPSEEFENGWVAQRVKTLIAEGVQPHDIAVLFRNNKDSIAIATALLAVGVSCQIESRENILGNHTIRQLLAYMRAAVFYGEDVPLTDVLHAPWNRITPHDMYRVLHAARKNHESVYTILSNPKKYDEKITHYDAIHALHTTLEHLAQTARSVHARDFLHAVLHESGFLTYILSLPNSLQLLASVRGLSATLESLSQHKNDYGPIAFLQDIELFESYGLQIESDMVAESVRGVRLMTVHGSKGLEFEHVFMVHVRDGKWGNVRDMRPFYIPGPEREKTDDERRLFYVALTRARKTATLSFGQQNSEGTLLLPSQFIAEMGEHAIQKTDDAFIASYRPEQIFTQVPKSIPQEEAEYLRATFLEQGLSVTALNNFLECPWRYFYRNLVRIPEPVNKHLLLGNAVHECVRAHFEQFRQTENLPSLDSLLARIPDVCIKQGFWKKDLAEAEEKARIALSGWYEMQKHAWTPHVKCEVPFELRVTLESELVPSLLLRGKIDRIDYLDTGTVRVIDYKTGKPKSRNDILGNTKSSNGEYYRQLVFYKLLLQEQKGEPLSQAMIDFLEPNDKGVYKSELFTADELDVPKLAQELTETAESIYTFSFWNSTCSDSDCPYCRLRESLS
jgi:DNA helicase-2/ATP-dependent DNA helicase PcrA